MKRLLLPLTAISALSLFFFLQSPTEKEAYRDMVNAHPYSQRTPLTMEELEAIPKRDRPDLAWEQDFLATIDPNLGRPTPERLHDAYRQVETFQNQTLSTPGAAGTPWVERGPTNVGGRTRAIMFDPNDTAHKKVWAGGVTGGLWYNNDITDINSTWVAVDDFWDNISITSIAHDPTNTNVFYVGTGEGWGAGASRGEGVWKSIDGGATWTQLSATTSFYYVNDLVVRNESGTGVLYVGTRGNYYNGQWHGSAAQGLQRSTNGGSSFTQVMPNIPGETFNYAVADIELAANGRIWVGTQDASYGGTDRGGGRILYSDNGTTWTSSYNSTSGDRVEIACAPSNSNYVYALVEVSSQIGELKVTTNGGTTWGNMTQPNDADPGISSTDFSRGQAWYDMILAVDPTSATTVYAGAIDLFRSTNTGGAWTQISHWYGGFGYPYVHADQHQLVFNPNNSSQLLIGNDGGVQMTDNPTASSPTFTSLNRNYNVTQFYAAALHPNSGSNYALAGTQDNGTQQFSVAGLAGTVEVTGGDGAFCFIDQTNPNIQITSYVYNSYWRSTDGGSTFQNPRFINDQSTGRFINPADYDDNQDALYSARTTTTLNRALNVGGTPSVSAITIPGMSDMASHIRVSPYTTSSTTLFVGTGSGDLFKVTNANSSPSATSIGSALPAGYISCVEIGASENELLVTYTNYGLTSVWYTNNGGTTWVSKEGNLPDMPVRWALFNPNDRTEVILATEVGVWETSNFGASSPSWSPSNSGLANVRVDMLQIRDSDDMVIAATHGRGMFMSNGFGQPTVPVADFTASNTSPCVGESVSLMDNSTGIPTSYAWYISPSTFSYLNGTDSTSASPEVSFSASGTYTIGLTVSNANGTDSVLRIGHVDVGGYSLPYSEDFESGFTDWTIDNPDAGITWTSYTVGGNSPGSTAMGINNYSYSTTGQRDGLISPPLDFTGYSSITLDFDYAYRRYSSSYQDSLAVYISTDCGATWTKVASYRENGTGNFVTGSDLTSSFTPSTTGDWCGTSPTCPSINLNAYAGNSGVKIKIENINGYGNYLYVDNINVTGVLNVAPTSNFTASSTQECENQTITFTDNSTGSPSSWSWTVTPSSGVSYVGGTSATSQNSQIQFSNSGSYDVSLTATNGIGSDVELKSSYITIDPVVTPSASISVSQNNICSGTSVTFTATPSGGGSSPSYQWKLNGSNVGSNSSTYTSSSLSSSDSVWVELTSSESCASPATVSSNGIGMNVTPTVSPSVSISSSSSTICSGTNVTFTANPSNGGSSPQYAWKVNGSTVGTNSTSFSSSTLANGDVVTVELTNSDACVSTATVTSNSITMTVNPSVTPQVAVSNNSTGNVVCDGTSVLFTATPTNGGNAPVYQWIVNGAPVGTNSSTYTLQQSPGVYDVRVALVSSASCLTQATDTSSISTITVDALPTVTLTTPFIINAYCKEDTIPLTGTPSGGTFSGAGVNGAEFRASDAGNGTHWVYYTYTNSNGCSASDSASVLVEIVPEPQISYSNGVLTCTTTGFPYQWFDANGPITGETNQTFTPTANGTYYVRISGTDCFDESSSISVNDIHLEEWSSVSSVSLYPIPATHVLTLEVDALTSEEVLLEVTEMSGKVVIREVIELQAGSQSRQLEVGNLTSGAYLLRMTGESGAVVKPFEIVR